MATLNLGRIKPVFRGAWTSGAFVIDDIVTHGNETFICIQAGTNIATSDASYWTKLAAKGTDGTDVGTTITTQGDILYRDGSGLQRLAKGTAAQVLKMNTAANAPEWGDLSSDFVKIIAGSHSGTELNLDNIFTSDYDLYKVYLTEIVVTSSWFGMRVRTGGASGTTNTDSEYRYASKMFYRSSGSGGDTGEHAWNNTYFRLGWDVSESVKKHSWELTIPNPIDTGSKFAYYQNNLHFSNVYIGSAIGAGTIDLNESTQFTGLNFYQNGGNSWTGKYKVYGIKS